MIATCASRLRLVPPPHASASRLRVATASVSAEDAMVNSLAANLLLLLLQTGVLMNPERGNGDGGKGGVGLL